MELDKLEEKLEKLYKKKITTNEVVDLLNDIAWETGIEDISKMKSYAEEAYEMASELHYELGLAHAKRTIIYINQPVIDIEERLRSLNESLMIFEKEGLIYSQATVWYIFSRCYIYMGVYDRAAECAYKSMNLYEEVGSNKGVAWCYYSLGSIHRLLKNVNKAEGYYTTSLEKFSELGYEPGFGPISMELGTLYRNMGLYEKSLEYLKKTHKWIMSQELYYGYIVINLKIAITYRKLEDYGKADEFIDDAIFYMKKFPSNYYKAIVYHQKGIVCYSKGDNSSALDLYIKSLDYAVKDDNKPTMLNIYQSMAEVYEEMGDYKNENYHLKEIAKLKDELFSIETTTKLHNLEIEKQKQIADTEIKYQTKLKKETEKLLLNILPEEIMKELMDTGKVIPKLHKEATIIFTDFVGFTTHAEKIEPNRLVEELDHYFSEFDSIIKRYGIEKLKTIGDGYMAVSGVPNYNKNHALNAVKAAIDMLRYVKKVKQDKKEKGESFWELRIGINTGSIVAGVVGKEKFAFDIWGDAVNIASRIESAGELDYINISPITYEYIKEEFVMDHSKMVHLKGKGEFEIISISAD